MPTPRFWIVAIAATPLVLASACGDEDATTFDAPAAGAGGDEAAAGTTALDAGRAGVGEGGNPPGAAASGGVPSSAGAGQEGGSAPHAGGGGAGPLAERLSLCDRLQSPRPLSFDVTQAYKRDVFQDCRVTWVTRLWADLGESKEYSIALQEWTLGLWGCEIAPVDTFKLIHTTAPLTAMDAKALIDHYLQVAGEQLSMSVPEIVEMRAALERLSTLVVVEGSEGFSKSQCSEGGAGGSANGAGGGDAGAAGLAAGLAGQGGQSTAGL